MAGVLGIADLFA